MAAAYKPITIQDLKKNLGDSLGLRKNKYLLEVPLSTATTGYGNQLNVLCQATSLPERNMSTTSVYMTGRKYNVRGETEYQGTYEISLVDDSSMNLRKEFDSWMFSVDNSNNSTSDNMNNPSGDGLPYIQPLNAGLFNLNNSYQADIKIWQLDANGNPVYGYALQNAFPSSIGTVELDDSNQSEMSQFSVTLTYSEMIPITFTGNVNNINDINGTNQSYINSLLGLGIPDSVTKLPVFQNLENKIENKWKSNLPDFAYPTKPGQILNDLGKSTANSIKSDIANIFKFF